MRSAVHLDPSESDRKRGFLVLMDSPRTTWLQLVRGQNGFSAAADSMRRFFTECTGMVTPGEAFGALWRLHCDDRRANDPHAAALLVVLAHVGDLETHLASTLLLCDLADVADDLKAFATAADRWKASGVLPPASSAVWIQLLQVAVILLASSAEASLQKERLHGLQEHLKAYGAATLAVKDHEDQSDVVMDWNEFLALGSGLEQSALRRTKDGRNVVQQLRMVNAQQQGRLANYRSLHEGADVAGALEVVWDAATSLVKCCPSASDSAESMSMDHDGPYQFIYDGSSLVSCIRDASGLSAPLPTSTAQGDGQSKTFSTAEQVPLEETIETLQHADGRFIDDQIRELATIHDVSVLSVRVSSLLGLQLCRERTFTDSVASARSSQWEQSIRRIVNSLTSAGGEEEELLQLLRLAAVHPSAVIEILMADALTTTQHHDLVTRLLLECPLLVMWTETPESNKPEEIDNSIVITMLSRAVHRVACQADATMAMVQSPAFRLVLHLATATPDKATTNQGCSSGAVLSPDVCMRLIFWSAFKLFGDSITPSSTSRLFTLMHFFVVNTHGSGRFSASTLRTSLEMSASVYPVSVDDTPEHQELRDSLLLVTDALLRARSPTSKTPRPETRAWTPPTGIRMQCLLVSHDVLLPELQGDECEDLSPHAELSQISDELQRSIDQTLWRLVWTCDRAECAASTDQDRKFLHELREREFGDGNLKVTGSCAIQTQISEMLRSSGGRVFERIVQTIGNVILPIVVDTPVTDSTASQQLMEYVLRCWSVSAFSSKHGRDWSVVRMLMRTMGLIDQVIESASLVPPVLVRCLQATGLLYSWLRSHPQDDAMASTIDRVEVTAMRVLFQLRHHQPDLPAGPALTQEEKAVRSAVATLLVSTRLIERESVVTFLRSHS